MALKQHFNAISTKFLRQYTVKLLKTHNKISRMLLKSGKTGCWGFFGKITSLQISMKIKRLPRNLKLNTEGAR